MKNIDFMNDPNLSFGAELNDDTGLIRWSDCGGSEIYAEGDEDDMRAVEALLRRDDRDLPGDPDDDRDDRALVEFWTRVEAAIRTVC